MSPDLHYELYSLYDSVSNNVENLKKEIKKATIANPKTKSGLTCPYCGITRNILHDLDHFMPRSKYPEFSILSNNLIYVCSECNQDFKKNTFLINSEDPIRKFLNPYYDLIDEEELMICNISCKGIILNIEYIANPELILKNKYLYDVTKNHIDSLCLNERYVRNILRDLLEKFLNTFRDKSIVSHRKIRNFKNIEVKHYINYKINELGDASINNFELLFWKKFINCNQFFNAIKGVDL
ncbi:HNH endonuclease [Aliarcobacter sp. ERUVET-8]|uniref:HNH endonuclease n=1 Tax=Aliarcobacter sp. ERUVET-8 TaxID=3429684 RepID=UPI003D6B4095